MVKNTLLEIIIIGILQWREGSSDSTLNTAKTVGDL